MFLIVLFFMPETLFDRPENEPLVEDMSDLKEKIEEHENISINSAEAYRPPPMDFQTYLHRLWFWDLDRPSTRRMKASDFVIKPLSMLKYPSVALPALYLYVSPAICAICLCQNNLPADYSSSVTYGFASIEPALILATVFTRIYNFDTVRNG